MSGYSGSRHKNTIRLGDCGYNRHGIGPGSYDIGNVLGFNPAYSNYGDSYPRANCHQALNTLWDTGVFGSCFEHRAVADVVSPLFLRGERLVKAVGRDADYHACPGRLSG